MMRTDMREEQIGLLAAGLLAAQPHGRSFTPAAGSTRWSWCRPESTRKDIAMPVLAVFIGITLFITVYGALALRTSAVADELNSAGVVERP
jgi:hypothetical protein